MAQPFISICIPTYKRAELLKKLLDSIQMQNFRDFEILINDNSPDDTVKNLVEDYKQLFPLYYEKNDPTVPAVVNGNKVMRRAKAPWVKMIHDDDWFDTPDALQQFAEAANRSGKDFIFCASNSVYLETGKKEPELLTPEKKRMLDDSVFSLFYLNVIGHPSVVMHRNDSSILYDEQFNWVLDVDYYMRYIYAHGGYHYIPETLVNIGKSAGQESSKFYKNGHVEIPEYFTMLAKYPSDFMLKNEQVFHLVWNMLKRYKIRSIEDIIAFGYHHVLPDRITELIQYQRRIPQFILKQPGWSEKFVKKSFKRIKSN
jgi:glycosyltransferase involved in cell wall biosynthesis